MPITDHVAILAHSSLDVPSINRLNPAKPAAFYAQLAFPAAAFDELKAIAAAVAPGGNFAGLEVGVSTNGALKKPVPGIPADWLVVRASTQYAPYVADGAGVQLDQGNPANHATIKQQFYAGKKVRAALSAFAWYHQPTNRRGISFNLQGIMASDDAERLNIGQGVVVNALQQYADPSKAASNVPVPGVNAQNVPQGPNANPFAQGVVGVAVGGVGVANTGAPAQSANPFAQQMSGPSGNPFATT